MPSLASDRVAAAMLAVLLIASVSLKAMIGPPPKASPGPGLVEAQAIRTLQARGFATRLHQTRYHGFIVFAARGDCRLSVRDARNGQAEKRVYERDAAAIGSVRYLMGGRSYGSPPTLALLAGMAETRLIRGLGLTGSVPVAVALATSPACKDSDFGLSNPEVPV